MGSSTPFKRGSILTLHKNPKVMAGLVAVIASLSFGATIILRHLNPPSLLPSHIIMQTTGLEIFFYKSSIPAGYSLDTARVTYSSGVLFAPLIKNNAPPITITVQAIPPQLSKDTLQQNGSIVRGAAGSATINSVEGRLVGTLVSASGKTLVLLSSPASGNTTKADLTLLLQGLRQLQAE